MAPTTQAEGKTDARDDSVLVAVVHKNQIANGAVKDGINPGMVTLGWLRFGENATNWVEVDPVSGKKVTAAQVAKATDGQEG